MAVLALELRSFFLRECSNTISHHLSLPATLVHGKSRSINNQALFFRGDSGFAKVKRMELPNSLVLG